MTLVVVDQFLRQCICVALSLAMFLVTPSCIEGSLLYLFSTRIPVHPLAGVK